MTKKILMAFGLLAALGLTATNNAASPANKKLEGKKAVIYTTAQGSDLKLTVSDTLTFAPYGQPVETETCIFIDPTAKYQTFLGIGGALTDASAEVFAKLSKEKQQELLRAYYDQEKGIGYSLARTNIHSCDFSSGSYTYVKDGDKGLSSFSVDHDKEFRIPFIKQAFEAAKGKMKLFVSPWSPPAWMKNNNDMLKGGKLKPEFYQTWANYFSKFIKAYEKEGIPVWGLTIQNEPMAKQTWESCIFTAEEETAFLKNNLGPTLKKDGLGDKKIIVWDHNRDLLFQRATTLLKDPAASKYVWGVGFHWYEDWGGTEQTYENVRRVKERFPDKNIFLTEACNGPFDMAKINDWIWGERYGKAMINDFNNGAAGWTDWNVLLDENGGPNHLQNFCYAPVHGNLKTGELIYTNAYYYIGHFSRFIRPDAKRLGTASSKSTLMATAFENKDGKTAAVVMNPGNKEIEYILWIEGNAVKVKSLPHSIQTVVF